MESRMKFAAYVARIGEMRNTCSTLMEKPEGNIPLGRPRRGRRIILKCMRARFLPSMAANLV
jgi:hypothetical protein